MAAHPAIDPRIQGLPSTTFFGKRLTRRQIADVQEMVHACSGLSRTELAKTVCEHLRWKAGSGASRVRLATRFLEQLAAHGIVSLPAKQPRPRGPDRAVALSDRTPPGRQSPPISPACGHCGWTPWRTGRDSPSGRSGSSATTRSATASRSACHGDTLDKAFGDVYTKIRCASA